MVGEYAYLRLMVDKAFVDGRYYGGEHYAAVATVGEYGAQTLYLLLAVGEHIYGVAVGNEAREGVGNKVEVLMIYPLGSAAETYHRCIGGIAVGSDVGGRSETHLPHGGNRRGERVGVDNLPESVGVAFLGNRGTGAESVGGHGAYSLKGKPHVARPDNRVRAYEVEQRHG